VWFLGIGRLNHRLTCSLSFAISASLVVATSTAPAFAALQINPVGAASKKQPVLLRAQQVDYDQQNEVVYASGQVEIMQGDAIVLADAVMYDLKRDQVQAMGNVIMLEPSGHVFFASSVALKDDLKSGVIRDFKARLSDDSVFVANGAKRVNENIVELFKAAYTPCDCGTPEKPKVPMWSFKAHHATIDQEEQRITYEDAYFNIYGVPAFYTPYLSHPTPDAENQSGLLMPEFLQSKNLGTVFKQPVYYAIAPDRDVTITPIITTKEGPVLATSYRQMFDNGSMNIGGSITNAENRDSLGNRLAGHELRGHFDGKGKFRINDFYNWGFDVKRASDDTYLHRYNFSNETLLTSRIYSEGFNFIGDTDRNYASVEGLSFQGLTGEDATGVIPVVAPLINFTWQSRPLEYNSRFTMEGNTMALFRSRDSESQRLSGTVRWNLPYVTDNGQILELETQMRTDIYQVSNVQLDNGRQYDGTTGRTIPQLSLAWRYPFINRFEDASLMVEPITHFTISPGGGNPEKIPNEDSLLPDFTDSNLFSSNRFAGYDRVENGPRFSYGLRSQAQFNSDKYVDLLIGQQYRAIDDPNFPISNDLTSDFSDYVGKVGMTYAPLSLGYRFRLDKTDLTPSRSEIDAGYNLSPLTISTSYLYLNNDPILFDREVVTASGTLDLTDNWSILANGSRDIRQKQTVTTNGGLVYKNECVTLTSVVGKDYTSLLDIKPSLSFWFRVSLRNLD
jgi:LPS-assembly protein